MLLSDWSNVVHWHVISIFAIKTIIGTDLRNFSRQHDSTPEAAPKMHVGKTGLTARRTEISQARLPVVAQVGALNFKR